MSFSQAIAARTLVARMLLALCVLPAILPADARAEDYRAQRLSADASSPLFHVLMMGLPTSDFAAFLSDEEGQCRLEIRSFVSNRVVVELRDFVACPPAGDVEDGYAFLNLTRFQPFLARHRMAIESLLASFGIAQRRGRADAGRLRMDADGSHCLMLDAGEICAGSTLNISRPDAGRL